MKLVILYLANAQFILQNLPLPLKQSHCRHVLSMLLSGMRVNAANI